MAELTADDVEAYTDGRLTSSDEVERMLAAALSVARREVGWHVSPVHADETMVLDGPDSRILNLPTMKVVGLTAISEDGTALDVADVSISAGGGPHNFRPIALRKRGSGCWTAEYGGIELEMTHGFTEAEAADWRQAILGIVDQISLLPVRSSTGASGFGVSTLRVDDVAVSYSPYASMAEEVVFSHSHILCKYKLPTLEYL